MLLAGDVGATKTLIGLFERAPERPRPAVVREYPTQEHHSLAAMLDGFARDTGEPIERAEAACFGVAGPVVDQVARLTNVPWLVDATSLSERYGLRRVRLLNDLAAMACAVPVLEPDELAVLQEGQAVPSGNAALIAAGTGLGEALLHNVDGRFVPSASEGGHADFAPRTSREADLLRELIRTYGRAEYEHVVSGPGLVNIHRFTHAQPCQEVDAAADPADAPALITGAAMAGRCAACVEALEIFVSAYGAEAGNLALRSVATAGVYVGGGIAPKLLPVLEAGRFLEAFRAKAPMTDFMAAVPVSVILNADAALLGAATCVNDR